MERTGSRDKGAGRGEEGRESEGRVDNKRVQGRAGGGGMKG